MSRPLALGTSRWPTICLVVGAGVISAWQVGKMPVALDAIQSDLAVDLAAASWLLSAFAFIGAVAGAPIGLAVDHIGAKRMTLAGLLLQGIASTAGSVAPNAVVLGATRVAEGLGFLAVIVAAPALIVTLASPSDRERAMALWATFMPAGMSSIMLAAPFTDELIWRGLWISIGVAHIAYVAALALGLRHQPIVQDARSEVRQDMKVALRAPGPWLLGGLFAAQAAAFFAVFGFLPSILSERLAVSSGVAGVLSAIAVAASAAGNIICGRFLARGVAPTHLLSISFATLACSSFGIFGEAVPGPIAYALCLVFSVAGGVIPVVVLNAAPGCAPRPHLVGLTLGFAMQGNNVGLAMGPAAVGALVSATGWWATPYFIVATTAIAGVLIVMLSRLRLARARPELPRQTS
jgi:predicted MFS family arabinose efflux permease